LDSSLATFGCDLRPRDPRRNRLIRFRVKLTTPVTLMFVKQLIHISVASVTILALFTASNVAQARPLGLFFRVVRNGIPHPEHRSRLHRSSTRNEEPANDASNSGMSGSPVTAPPNERNVRRATADQATKPRNNNSPYGTPVPGKQGLVTSPFSQNSGYIDVRGIPPGTEVKDPYTGDIFLTP